MNSQCGFIFSKSHFVPPLVETAARRRRDATPSQVKEQQHKQHFIVTFHVRGVQSNNSNSQLINNMTENLFSKINKLYFLLTFLKKKIIMNKIVYFLLEVMC